MPFDTIPPEWKNLLGDDYCNEWENNAADLYRRPENLFPCRENLFRAFGECLLDYLKVVVLGEKPYKNENANGLAFSVPSGSVIPPTLWIIFSEICHDLCPGVEHENGDLSRWARQGVLLLNSQLTVGQRGIIRWGDFSRHVMRRVYERDIGVVFMLWGDLAIKKGESIMNEQQRHRCRHLILKSSHPSSRSAFKCVGEERRFAGCKHFSCANEWLRTHRGCVVNWR